jgi:hypothetical protein
MLGNDALDRVEALGDGGGAVADLNLAALR